MTLVMFLNVFKYKTETESKNPTMHFLPSEISEGAANTQCGVASPRTAFQHPRSTAIEQSLRLSTAAQSLSHQYSKEATVFPAKDK